MDYLSDIVHKGKVFLKSLATANGSTLKFLLVNTATGEVVEKDIITEKDWVSLGTLNDGIDDFTENLSLEQGKSYTARITVQCEAKDGDDRLSAQIVGDMTVFYIVMGASSGHYTDGLTIISNVGFIKDAGPFGPAAVPLKMGDILIEPNKSANMLRFKIGNHAGIDNMNIRYCIQTIKHDFLKTR